jgi:hypothetical protein
MEFLNKENGRALEIERKSDKKAFFDLKQVFFF